MTKNIFASFGFSGVAAICMDLGHLTLQRGTDQTTDSYNLHQPKVNVILLIVSNRFMSIFVCKQDIEGVRELSYTQFKLKLTDVQLIYAHRSELKSCMEINSIDMFF